jgi:hypothetical protein
MVANVYRVAVSNTRIEIAMLVDSVFPSLLNYIHVLSFCYCNRSETSKLDPFIFWKLWFLSLTPTLTELNEVLA